MTFDREGHVCLTPREVDDVVRSGNAERLRGLIDHALLRGTPAIFSTHLEGCQFIDRIASGLSVHASSIAFRGSTKIGFSIAPKVEKIWRKPRPDADIDLVIVDPDYYHFLDSEVRRWERNTGPRFRGQDYMRNIKLRDGRRFYCYRYMDVPNTTLVAQYQSVVDAASALPPEGCGRPVRAFFFRDWWALQSRYEYDLRELMRGLQSGELPTGSDAPLPCVLDDPIPGF